MLIASVPAPAVRGEDPIAVLPSWNVTVPVGLEVPEVGTTLVLRVIVWPETAVAGLAVRVTVVACSGAVAALT